MLSSVFRPPGAANSPPYASDQSTRSKPLLQKLLLRSLPGFEETVDSPTSSHISHQSASFMDSGSSTNSPVDRNSMSLPVYHSGRKLTHHDSPERPSSASTVTSVKSIPRTPTGPTARSGPSLHLDPQSQNVDDWHRYPLCRQLSPIVEQDYVSPDTLRLSVPLPPVDHDTISVNEPPPSSVIRNGSPRSEITRPSPVYSAQTAFVSRQLNRSLSQTSSRTYRSTGSTPISAVAPSIPPIDLTPAFPGPHPSNSVQDDGVQPLRMRHGVSPKGTSLAASGGDPSPSEEAYSLHADSFITASEHPENTSDRASSGSLTVGDLPPSPISARNADSASSSRPTIVRVRTHSTLPSSPLRQSQVPEGQENIFPAVEERSVWDRDSPSPPPRRPSYEFLGLTPACWMFWLGFICPLTWLVGGWYFTVFQETGDDWRAIMRVPSFPSLPRIRRQSSIRPPPRAATRKSCEGHTLPLWAKRSWSEETVEHLTPQELELVKRLWSGYPFLDQTPSRPNSIHGRFFKALKVLGCLRLSLIGSPTLNSRRYLDPWIWRCRVAMAFFVVISVAIVVVCLALFIPRVHITVS